MSKIAVILLVLLLLASLRLILPVHVLASSRTIIVPDDYQTITTAIGNATDGDIILIRNGNYQENSLTINKTVSLIGENAQNTIIRNIDQPTMFLGSGLLSGPTAISFKANNVIIQRLTVITNNNGANIPGYSIAGGGIGSQILNSNLPDGISLSSGSYQLISQNNIGQVADRLAIVLEAPYTYITNNTITGGVKVQNPSGIGGHLNNVIYANSIKTTTNSHAWEAWGINIYMAQGNLVAKNSITFTLAGIVNDLSGDNTIIGNTITNSFIGLATIQGGGENTYFGNNVTSNSYAVATAGYKDTFYGNNFLNNVQEIGSPNLLRGPNPSPITYWYFGTQGNYWSNYSGLDENGDGVGETTYTIDANNTDPYPLVAPFNLTSIALPDWTNNISPAVLPSTFPEQTPPSVPSQSPSPTALFVSILSPANMSYAAIVNPFTTVPLTFVTNASLSWVGYSLDGGANVTAVNGTLIEIPVGSRCLTLYANDTAGNWAAPQTVYYDIAVNLGPAPSEPYSWYLVAVSVAVVAVVAVGVLAYVKKRKRSRRT